MSFIKIAGCLALFAFFNPNSPRSSIEFTKDSLKVVKKNVAKDKAVLVDVRSLEEWKRGHIDDSIFLPVTDLRKGGDPKKLSKTLPKKKILYTFCVVGMRAKTAAFVLQKHGYEVRALKPGYEELLKAGFTKAKAKKSSQNSTAENEDSRQRDAR